MNEAISVSELNGRVAELFADSESLADICVKGEISNFVSHANGHLYFTLKDKSSAVKAVMFGGARYLKRKPENGMSVRVRGGMTVYEPGGVYQIRVVEIIPEGRGDLHLAFAELKDRLQKQGLFSQKRPLPRSFAVKKIAVITAETGAALQDILNITARRNPLLTVVLIPALVQGANAPASLISAVQKAQETEAGLIIIGRGGGSIEDLWAFNDEGLARALYASKIPTVSAVGHETDFTIADFAADLRAPTPSAAAELSVPDIGELYNYLIQQRAELRTAVNRSLFERSNYVEALRREFAALSPEATLESYRKRFEAAETAVKSAVTAAIEAKKQSLIAEMNRVNALSPTNVLLRGYSIAYSNGRAVTDAANVGIGEVLDIKLHKGGVKAKAVDKYE